MSYQLRSHVATVYSSARLTSTPLVASIAAASFALHSACVLPKPEIERQYDEAFRELMRGLEKLERKLVLRLLDTRDLLAENAAFDSFVCGFRLALELTTESQLYQKERSEEALTVLCATEENEDEN